MKKIKQEGILFGIVAGLMIVAIVFIFYSDAGMTKRFKAGAKKGSPFGSERQTLWARETQNHVSNRSRGVVTCTDDDPRNSTDREGRLVFFGVEEADLRLENQVQDERHRPREGVPVSRSDFCQSETREDGYPFGRVTDYECNRRIFPRPNSQVPLATVQQFLRRGEKLWTALRQRECEWGCTYRGRCSTEQEAEAIQEMNERSREALAEENQAPQEGGEEEEPADDRLCEDSDHTPPLGPDSERSFTIKGTTRGFEHGRADAAFVTRQDYCLVPRQVAEYMCVSDRVLNNAAVDCPDNMLCVDGACVEAVAISECGEPQGGWVEGNSYTLTQDLRPQGLGLFGTCLRLEEARNITIDCNNHLIQSVPSPDQPDWAPQAGGGIHVIGSQNITITNCHIDNFIAGIWIGPSGTPNNPGNPSREIRILGNELTNNLVGLGLDAVVQSTFSGNRMTHNVTGVDFWFGNNREVVGFTLNRNVIRNNRDFGLHVEPNVNNAQLVVSNNEICANTQGQPRRFDVGCRELGGEGESPWVVNGEGNRFGTIDVNCQNILDWPTRDHYSPCE